MLYDPFVFTIYYTKTLKVTIWYIHGHLLHENVESNHLIHLWSLNRDLTIFILSTIFFI